MVDDAQEPLAHRIGRGGEQRHERRAADGDREGLGDAFLARIGGRDPDLGDTAADACDIHGQVAQVDVPGHHPIVVGGHLVVEDPLVPIVERLCELKRRRGARVDALRADLVLDDRGWFAPPPPPPPPPVPGGGVVVGGGVVPPPPPPPHPRGRVPTLMVPFKSQSGPPLLCDE